ncbi:ATP-binding protein [Kitasatospora griseola]|uniref:ATP-binding protein n=1 Tax=Kitasatospora griseola TaxID=2064 RepID=UPI001F3EC87B|nr:ATP-binding protein [Kitasatospora griseola]
MAGWGEAERALPSVDTRGDGSSGAGAAVVLAELERMTANEMERAFLGVLGDPEAGEEVRLPSRPESAGVARRLVLSVLASWKLHHLLEVGELLTGELVANAVRHAGGRMIGLKLVRRPGWLRIEVRDSSRAMPCLILAPEIGRYQNGHGLRVVDELSDRWGADLLPRGKGVWFEVKTRDRSVP